MSGFDDGWSVGVNSRSKLQSSVCVAEKSQPGQRRFWALPSRSVSRQGRYGMDGLLKALTSRQLKGWVWFSHPVIVHVPRMDKARRDGTIPK